ncbi:lipoate--protein ligase [Mesoplasma syrphidae]|uniref:lipoate--protein ligase n=1 Tax=Mesoplasma syrphidae TaxID=225999 RepID=A0A2K9BY09_9MOLU|nr:lipoate--protein ligase [Mesoplasma syrphidae]AUF83248.1 lipoate--protein ligase [Mesoplasma syrphidae]
MISLIVSRQTNPYWNLACEEYLTYNKNFKTPIFFLWQNQNTIVVGRNQNAYSEINIEKANANEVTIVRRNTGGGTVYQDLGNICFSLIVENDQKSINENFQRTLNPIVDFLRDKNLNASFSGRNDIEIDGFKVSGNAQLKTNDRVLQHGTLLYDVDLAKINDYLIVDRTKMESKKIASVSSRVANISALLNETKDLKKFINDLKNSYLKNQDVEEINLSSEDLAVIDKLAKEKYSTWEWTFGKNASFAKTTKVYLPNKGLLEIRFSTSEGYISNIKFYGDFLGYLGTENLEKLLIGQKYEKDAITNVIRHINMAEIFGDTFEIDDITNLLF